MIDTPLTDEDAANHDMPELRETALHAGRTTMIGDRPPKLPPARLIPAPALAGAARSDSAGAVTPRRTLESLLDQARAALALIRRAAVRTGGAATLPGDGSFEIRPLLGIIAAFWAVVIAVDFVNDWLLVGFVVDVRPVRRVAIDMAVWWGLWIAMVPPLLLVTARLDPERVGLRRSAAIHLFLALAVGLLHFVLAAHAFEAFDASPDHPMARLRRWIASFTLSQTLTYCGFVGVVYAAHFWRRARTILVRSAGLERKADRLERTTTEARLRALRRELETHLMLNALNNLSALVRTGRREATLRLVRGLGDLVRSGAEDGRAVQVTLAREVELLGRYVELVDPGDGGRPRVRVRIDPDVGDALVPPFLLQPLVENALVHGCGPVEVRGHRIGRALRLEVSNDLPPEAAGPRRGVREGTGLATTRARLDLLHPGTATLEVTAPSGRVRAVVELPLERG